LDFFAYSKVNVRYLYRKDVCKINLVYKNINLLQLMLYYEYQYIINVANTLKIKYIENTVVYENAVVNKHFC